MADRRICSIPGCGKKYYGRGYCSQHYQNMRATGSPLGKGRSPPKSLVFLRENVGYSGADCLAWPFGKFTGGYGMLEVNYKVWQAHRLMCTMAHGEPPSPNLEAAHSCGNGHLGCVSPRHLRWATHAENMADKIAHGTSNRSTRNGQSVLTEEDVIAIVERRRAGATFKDIGVEFGVHAQTVSSIVSGRQWSWLTGIRAA